MIRLPPRVESILVGLAIGVPLTGGLLVGGELSDRVEQAGRAAEAGNRLDPADIEPARFTIRPDGRVVRYAGTAEDGRHFYLGDELHDAAGSYVGLFLWASDGTFDRVEVTRVPGSDGTSGGQAAPPDAQVVVEARLAELGDYTLEPISVAPFLATVDGVEFGWSAEQFITTWAVSIRPGGSLSYYAPWDGDHYDVEPTRGSPSGGRGPGH